METTETDCTCSTRQPGWEFGECKNCTGYVSYEKWCDAYVRPELRDRRSDPLVIMEAVKGLTFVREDRQGRPVFQYLGGREFKIPRGVSNNLAAALKKEDS